MKKKINKGELYHDKKGRLFYMKSINYNKAVLWHTKELSVNPEMIDEHKEELYSLVFVDKGKKRVYYIPAKRFFKVAEKVKRYQEEQYYFPIEALLRKDLN